MTLTTFVGIAFAIYGLSVLACYGLSLHAMRQWHTAYWRQRRVNRLTACHPAVSAQWFSRGIPTRGPTDADWSRVYRWCLLPAVNTALVVCVLLRAVADALRRKAASAELPHDPVDQRIFG